MLARYGGEEFAVLCRGSSNDGARNVAERLRLTVEHANFSFDGIAIPVTVSAGVAAYPEFLAAGPSELLGAADSMLYEAKRSGRNRVAVRK
jgi:diguanylate cyclase (GGDEF)-like protein